jgi:glucan phosphoethanolaminetransferase (alkaline phosphatase superfamily)
MVNSLARATANLAFSPRRKTAIVIGAFLLLSAVTAAAFFPTRPKIVVFTTLVWSGFFGALYRMGYARIAATAVVIFWLLVAAEKLNFGQLERGTVLAYTGLLMAVVMSAVSLHQVLPGKAKRLPLLIAGAISVVLAVSGSLYIWHNLEFGVPVTPYVIYAVYQTNPSELREFLMEFADVRYFLPALIGILALGVLSCTQGTTPTGRINPVLLLALVALPLGTVALYRGHLRVFEHAIAADRRYRSELNEFKKLHDLRTAGQIPIHATKNGSAETYVVVIGESLNRNHMHLYGYHRSTTPSLDSLHRAGDLLKFDNAYATHTHTMPVLSLALTAANQRNGLSFYESPSLVEVARAAGFETHWITNQQLYGAYDNLVSIVAQSAENLVALNRNVGRKSETRLYDEATIPALEEILARKTDRNRLVFVHLAGSHLIYCQRFPVSFHRYTGELDPGEFGKARRDPLPTNCYDNSVLYNDHVVAGLLGATRRHGGVAAFLYVADHGEDVLAGNRHHSSRFTYSMVEIPMLVWVSGAYRREYEARYAALREHSQEIFATDFLFDTVLGMAGIRTPHYDPVVDLSDRAYGTTRIDFRLLEGARGFLDEGNVRYHQRQNIAKLAAAGLASRIVPHRVNSTGKLAEILYDGYRSLELDVLHRPGQNGGHFEVGHGEKDASGHDLAEVLELMPRAAMEKVWIDVKNLNAENLEQVTAELRQLESRFGLKRRVIFESPAAEQLPAITKEGFHTSYYLPTELLLRLSATGARDRLRREAERIARLATGGRLNAVSFDARLYKFVKTYLEPILDREIVYHTWDTTLWLTDPAFLKKLRARKLFGDPRVKTILVSYHSEMAL